MLENLETLKFHVWVEGTFSEYSTNTGKSVSTPWVSHMPDNQWNLFRDTTFWTVNGPSFGTIHRGQSMNPLQIPHTGQSMDPLQISRTLESQWTLFSYHRHTGQTMNLLQVSLNKKILMNHQIEFVTMQLVMIMIKKLTLSE